MITISEAGLLDRSGSSLLTWWRFLRKPGSPTLRLDLQSTPDHLKRDLGLLSGRAGPPRDVLRD